MSSSFRRGRTLEPKAVEQAKKWRENKLSSLNKKIVESGALSLTRNERRLWRQLAREFSPKFAPPETLQGLEAHQ